MYDRPTEAVREGGREHGREGGRDTWMDTRDAWMGTSMHGCMDYSDGLIGNSVITSKHNKYLSNPNYLLKEDW